MKKTQNYKIIDLHCHVLPGVDDGSSSMEESMEMLRIAACEGIVKMIATPHYKAGRKNVSVDGITRRIEQLQQCIDEEQLGIELLPGNEILYFDELIEELETKSLRTLCDSNYVLVEFLPGDSYKKIRNAVDALIGDGYIPVLAHVERYECLVKDMGLIKELIELGARVQINAGSVAGKHGWKIKKYVCQLLKEQLVDYIGTDAHDRNNRKPEMLKCIAVLIKKKIDSSYITAITHDNAMKIIEKRDE